MTDINQQFYAISQGQNQCVIRISQGPHLPSPQTLVSQQNTALHFAASVASDYTVIRQLQEVLQKADTSVWVKAVTIVY